MLPTIQFNNQLSFKTNEVHNIRRKNMLPPKLIPTQQTIPQKMPKL